MLWTFLTFKAKSSKKCPNLGPEIWAAVKLNSFPLLGENTPQDILITFATVTPTLWATMLNALVLSMHVPFSLKIVNNFHKIVNTHQACKMLQKSLLPITPKSCNVKCSWFLCIRRYLICVCYQAFTEIYVHSGFSCFFARSIFSCQRKLVLAVHTLE